MISKEHLEQTLLGEIQRAKEMEDPYFEMRDQRDRNPILFAVNTRFYERGVDVRDTVRQIANKIKSLTGVELNLNFTPQVEQDKSSEV